MGPPLQVAMTLTQQWHSVPGGTATAADAMAAALAAESEVAITAVVPAGAPTRSDWVPPVPTAALGVRVPWLYDAWHVARRPKVTSVAPRADLVHLTIPIACPRESVPMVATVHDLLPLTMPTMFNRRGVRLMGKGLERIRDEAAMVMVPSGHGVAEFVAHGFDPARLRVVPLGVTAVEPPDAAATSETLARLGVDAPYVLFVGTAEPRKGLDVLIDAMERLDRSDVTLVLVGPDGWGDALGDGIARLGARVIRLGYLPEADLRVVQAGASVCCLPSRAEGFGLPVLEAMAMGSPVVTTAATPMQEVADDAAICVPVGDVEALAAALATVLDDPALASTMSAAGRRRAEEFTWERTAAKVVEVYREVLAEVAS